MFTLRQLVVFTTLIEQKTTGAAAKKLCLSQSAVSTALAQLESQLGVRLFERTGRDLRPNPCAAMLLPRAQALLDGARGIERLFAQETVLQIGASTSIGNYFLPQHMAAFGRTHPGVQWRLAVANSREIVARMAAYELDCALIEGRFLQPGLQCTPWLSDALVCVCAPESRFLPQGVASEKTLRWRDMDKLVWLTRERGSGTRAFMDEQIFARLPHYTIGLELGHTEAIKEAVRQDLGIGWVSEHAVAHDLREGRLWALDLPWRTVRRRWWLVRHATHSALPALAAWMDYLLTQQSVDEREIAIPLQD